MSIRHVYIVTCDGCGTEFEVNAEITDRARDEVATYGWTARIRDAGFHDLCPACTAARRAPGAPTPAARGGEEA